MSHSHHPRCRAGIGLGLALVAWALATTVAAADVTIRQQTTSSGMGGFGNGTSTSTRVIAGDRSRSDDEHTYTGRFKTIAGGGKPQHSVSITRLDRELIWNILDDKKEYSELTFKEMRDLAAEGIARAQESDDAKPKDVDMDFTVDVKRTGKKESINGFLAEQVVITLRGTARDKREGEQGTLTLTMDEWLSQAVPGQAEVLAFSKRFADKLGLDPEAQRLGGMATAMYGNAIRRVADELKGLKGYPVRSTMTIATGPSPNPEQDAKRESAKQEASKERAEAAKKSGKGERAEDAQEAVEAGSQIKSGNASGAVGGFLARRLAKSMEKKAQAAAEKQAAESSGPAGVGMTVTTELISARVGPVVGVSFDVPAGYKRIEDRGSASPPSKRAKGKP